MKKIQLTLIGLLSMFFMVLLFACGTNSETEEGNNGDEQNVEQTSEDNQTNKDETSAGNLDLSAGEKIYKEKCMVCHQENGEGVEGTFPPLAKSDYLLADKERAIIQAINGSQEPITVNGVEYPGNVMTVFELSDQEVVDVINYVLNSWGNNGGAVTIEEVKKARAKIQ